MRPKAEARSRAAGGTCIIHVGRSTSHCRVGGVLRTGVTGLGKLSGNIASGVDVAEGAVLNAIARDLKPGGSGTGTTASRTDGTEGLGSKGAPERMGNRFP